MTRSTFFTRFVTLTLFVMAGSMPLRAQGNHFTHTITTQRNVPAQMGRDLWFAMIKNYDDQGGKFYNLYVTSPKATTIYVNMANQATKALNIQPYTVASFNIPLGWEIKTSAIVENKAIHVWSNDGDVCACLMSHNPYTSDGMYVVPCIGWDTTYVVAAYSALYEGFGMYNFDYPSEMVVVASQDNTLVTITPSADIRTENAPHACCSCIAHPKGVPFVEKLNRGQAIQYLTACTQDAVNYDLTGTVIHSNKPVGVVGGSMCTNIPMDFPYCDHVCDMMPTVRTWGDNYYSVPFYPAAVGKQTGTYLVVGTRAGQTIYRTDANGTRFAACILSKPYGVYWRTDSVDYPSRWTSDTAFLLVQYINSTTYPDGQNATGDPAEVILEPVDEYHKSITFQTTQSVGNIVPYINYVNVVVNEKAIGSTMFDGHLISTYTGFTVDGIYKIFRFSGVKPGAHSITSDSGVTAYVYGYGYDESYAWAGSLGTGTYHSPDTIAPRASTSNTCFAAHVALADTGSNVSLLNFIRLDSVYNMTYKIDSTWLEGAGRTSSFYDMGVIDNALPAFLQVSVYDRAGNRSVITSTYAASLASISPTLSDFGVSPGSPAVIRYDTIDNTGSVPFRIASVRLSGENRQTGYRIDSVDLNPILPGERRLVKLSFRPIRRGTVYDTLIVSDECRASVAYLLGAGRDADFALSNCNFGLVVLGDSIGNHLPDSSNTSILSYSQSTTIIIDSIWADSSQFRPRESVPFSLPAGARHVVAFEFTPSSTRTVASNWHAHSTTLGFDGTMIGTRTGILRGTGFVPADVSEETASDKLSLVLSDDGLTARAIVPAACTGDISLEIETLLGAKVLTRRLPAGEQHSFDLRGLPSGVYFYRLSCAVGRATGKIAIRR